MGYFGAPVRSLLFVPGTRTELLAKADASGADVIVLDLEDSVPAAGKDVARQAVHEALGRRLDRPGFVRINHPSQGMLIEDLKALAMGPTQALLVPKMESVDDLLLVDGELAALEQRNGLPRHTIATLIVVESALGMRKLFDMLCSTPRARGAVLASAEEGDLLADLGGRWSATGEALAYCRGKLVCDARAAGATWLIDGAFMNLADEAALTRESCLARTYGFTGKIAVHPRQVDAINRVFSPTQAEVDRARRLLAAFEAAEAQGRAAITFEGMMVDYANAKLARQVLALAAR